MRRLHVESYLNLPAGEDPFVRGRLALGVHNAEIGLFQQRQTRQPEVRIGIILDRGVTVALDKNDRLSCAVQSLFVNRVEGVSSLQLLRLIGAGYPVLFIYGASVDGLRQNAPVLQGKGFRREETLGGTKSAWKSGLVGELIELQWSIGFPGARVKSARVERPHLVAFQAGYRGNVVPRLTAELGILDVGAEDPTVVLKLVKFGVEGALDVADGTVGANREANGVRGKNGESVALEFANDRLPLLFRGRVLLQIGVGHPFVEGRRSWVVERVDGLVECRLVIKLEVDCDVDLGRWIETPDVLGKSYAGGHIGFRPLGKR